MFQFSFTRDGGGGFHGGHLIIWWLDYLYLCRKDICSSSLHSVNNLSHVEKYAPPFYCGTTNLCLLTGLLCRLPAKCLYTKTDYVGARGTFHEVKQWCGSGDSDLHCIPTILCKRIFSVHQHYSCHFCSCC